MTRHLIALAATTSIAAAAVLAGASLAFAGAGPQAAAPVVKTVQLERVVITGKRLPQGL